MPSQTAGAASGAMEGAALGTKILPGWGTAIGAVLGGVAGYFGTSKDKAPASLPAYQPVDIQGVQSRTIAGNLANFGDAALLSAKTNTFNQSETSRLLEQAIPGYGKLQARLLQQVNNDLNSQTSLPADVSDKIAQYAAEKGVTRGTSGQFNGFSLVKDFGFNLVDWQNAQRARALNTLSTVYGMAPRVNIMSPMASMVDPGTALQIAQKDNQLKYESATGQVNAANAAAASQSRAPSIGALIGTASDLYDKISGGFETVNAATVQSKVLATPNAQGDTMEPYVVHG